MPPQTIPVTPLQAASLPPTTRHEIYTALLSASSISAIESTLTHELQRTGWLANLRAYITRLLRTGEATTVEEVMQKVKAQMGIAEGMGDVEGLLGVLGAGDKGKGGAGVNGVNGTNGAVNGVNGAQSEGDDVDLKVPAQVVGEASRVIRKELEGLCEIVEE